MSTLRNWNWTRRNLLGQSIGAGKEQKVGTKNIACINLKAWHVCLLIFVLSICKHFNHRIGFANAHLADNEGA
jgi:hypothetical protein